MRRAWLVSCLLLGLLRASSGDDLVAHVRAALAYKNFALAENEIAAYRAKAGSTPAVLEAISWIGRGALAAGNLVGSRDGRSPDGDRRFFKEKLDELPGELIVEVQKRNARYIVWLAEHLMV